jgi:hypothetical protein
MDTRRTRGLAARLEAVRRRFEDWRRTRKIPSPIPAALWTAAVKVAALCGISRTAGTLRVNYNALRKRLEREATAAPPGPAPADRAPSTPAFVELTPPARVGACHCRLELEDGSGAKMRVELQDAQTPDLAALSRSFWEFRG